MPRGDPLARREIFPIGRDPVHPGAAIPVFLGNRPLGIGGDRQIKGGGVARLGPRIFKDDARAPAPRKGGIARELGGIFKREGERVGDRLSGGIPQFPLEKGGRQAAVVLAVRDQGIEGEKPRFAREARIPKCQLGDRKIPLERELGKVRKSSHRIVRGAKAEARIGRIAVVAREPLEGLPSQNTHIGAAARPLGLDGKMREAASRQLGRAVEDLKIPKLAVARQRDRAAPDPAKREGDLAEVLPFVSHRILPFVFLSL